MVSTGRKDPVLVVVQLSGGNDFLNTLVPYGDGRYYDHRPALGLREWRLLPVDGNVAFHHNLAPLKEMYDQGKVAVMQGIGYPDSSRSHFLSMSMWHNCSPNNPGEDGWLGRVIGEIDPGHENVLTGINFGRGLPRAMVAKGIPVTSLGDLSNYGLMYGLDDQEEALRRFKEMYAPAPGSPVMQYLSETGMGLVSGAEELKRMVPAEHETNVEYGASEISRVLRDVARIHLAGVGTRVFYASHGGYDTHAAQLSAHEKLLSELSRALVDFYQDLEDHGAADEVVTLVFTEFGRRVRDNGGGTDHGTAGGAFVIGNAVNGGLFGDYPSLKPGHLRDGEDLEHSYDLRGLYATLLEQWMGLDATPFVGGTFEQTRVFR